MLFILRLIVTLAYFVAVAALGLLLCLLRPFNPDNSYRIARLYAKPGQRILGMKVSAEGLEHLQSPGPCVIIANHQSNLDLFVLSGLLPRRTVTIGKKSLRWIPVFGLMYWLAGNVLIDRANSRKAMGSLDGAVKALRERKVGIWIFPEGTRNGGRNLLPFKRGAFHMAVQAGVPIIPVCVSSYPGQLDFRRLRSGQARIRVLPAMPTEGLGVEDLQRLIADCHQRMKACIDELDQAVQPAVSRLEVARPGA